MGTTKGRVFFSSQGGKIIDTTIADIAGIRARQGRPCLSEHLTYVDDYCDGAAPFSWFLLLLPPAHFNRCVDEAGEGMTEAQRGVAGSSRGTAFHALRQKHITKPPVVS